MKPISVALKNHLNSEITTLATCWKIVRKDGVTIGMTGHDKSIIYNSVLYQPNGGFVPSAIDSNSELAVDNLEIQAIIDEIIIKEVDIKAGLYDFAKVKIFLLNYNDLSQGSLILRTGWIGEIKHSKGYFTAEIRGLMQNFSQNIGILCSPSCRAKFGDTKCGVNLASYTFTGSITAIINNQIFIDTNRLEDAGYFSQGKITFTSGNNDGLSMEVKEFSSVGRIMLVLSMPYSIKIGDSYLMHAGCDKSFATCIDRFNNALNFRGEPHVPGIDAMLKTAGSSRLDE